VFNAEFIKMMKQKLGIKTTLVLASEMPLSGTAKGGTDVTLEISEILNASVYISGSGGKNYLDVQKYEDKGINVVFQEFHHPVYNQLNNQDFIPYLSVIDLYFNHGPNSLEIIMDSNAKTVNDV
jgi:hypothetical protein